MSFLQQGSMTVQGVLVISLVATMVVAVVIFLVSESWFPRTAKAAMWVLTECLGVVSLLFAWGAYQQGRIDPVPASKIFREIYTREDDPFVFWGVVVGFSALGALLLLAGALVLFVRHGEGSNR